VGDPDTQKLLTLVSYITNKYPTDYAPTFFENFQVDFMYGNPSRNICVYS
jgi:hypothetical protein